MALEARGRREIWPLDVLHFGFLSLMLVIAAVAFSRIPSAALWLAFDLAVAGTLILIEWRSARSSAREAALWRLLHGAVAIPLVFTQVGVTIHALRTTDHAAFLERLDRILFFGINPLEALERMSSPLLTELMQWAYTSYLLMPVGAGLLLAVRATPIGMSRALFSLLGVMYLSYIGYMIVPASGPNIQSSLGPLLPVDIPVTALYRFTDPLPGVWLTAELREWIFRAELTKKDCFPSGHVAVAVVCWLIGRGVNRAAGWVLFVLALGVILSTVYLRYHYVVDVIAGILLAWFASTGWLRFHDLLLRRYGSERLRGAADRRAGGAS